MLLHIVPPSRRRRRANAAASDRRTENVSNAGIGAAWNPVTQTPSVSALASIDAKHVMLVIRDKSGKVIWKAPKD